MEGALLLALMLPLLRLLLGEAASWGAPIDAPSTAACWCRRVSSQARKPALMSRHKPQHGLNTIRFSSEQTPLSTAHASQLIAFVSRRCTP